MPEDQIPVDRFLEEFALYLSSHPRAILSAPFGEGKSLFIDQARQHLADRFEFITLYPVNYQVTTNRDIFDLIKRDILVQLFSKHILKPETPLSKASLLSLFITECALLRPPHDSLASLLSTLQELDYPDPLGAIAVKGLATLFKTAKETFDSYCEKNEIPEAERQGLALLDKLEAEGIYEYDPLTRLIRESIENWKAENPDRKLVLVIEDLDRIDPSQIFRILNVFSAHIDYGHKHLLPVSADGIEGNKYGFDVILCVVDYNNLRSIYHHIYGPQTCWEGYIGKFASKGPFTFSLSEAKHQYFLDRMHALTGIGKLALTELFPKDLVNKHSTRQLNAALHNVEAQYRPLPTYTGTRVPKQFPDELLKIMVVLRRLGEESHRVSSHLGIQTSSHCNLMQYLVPFYFLRHPEWKNELYLGECAYGNFFTTYNVSCCIDKESFEIQRLQMTRHAPQLDDTVDGLFRFVKSLIIDG